MNVLWISVKKYLEVTMIGNTRNILKKKKLDEKNEFLPMNELTLYKDLKVVR